MELSVSFCSADETQELSVPMTKWLKAFPAMSSLHPFEAALLDLTVGKGTYTSVLGKVDSLRKALQEVYVD
jgi:nucleolar GTP-binding protein